MNKGERGETRVNEGKGGRRRGKEGNENNRVYGG